MQITNASKLVIVLSKCTLHITYTYIHTYFPPPGIIGLVKVREILQLLILVLFLIR